jgi:hypothetical protein
MDMPDRPYQPPIIRRAGRVNNLKVGATMTRLEVVSPLIRMVS